MYLYKDFNNNNNVEISLDHHFDYFSFIRFIHHDKKSAFKKEKEKDIEIQADFAASVVAQ